MKYKHSNHEIGYKKENGKINIVAICDICGAEHKNHYGYEIDFTDRKGWRTARRKCCAKCARQIVPILDEALERMNATANEMRSQGCDAR